MTIKKVGKRKYAYLAYRQGRKVIHHYLGPLSSPQVKEKIRKLEAEKKVPQAICTFFWEVDPSRIDLHRNARYVIERVLDMGSLEALHWLQTIYPTRMLIETFEVSRKLSERSRNFWRIWFGDHDAS
ncbi:MAG: hypothetical protein HYU64_20625 [Armatimonadetes bacterium]|nr:hypothetical protein [Armatimonadota bacterium]